MPLCPPRWPSKRGGAAAPRRTAQRLRCGVLLHGLDGRLSYSMRDASLPPKRRPQVQGRCETASRLPQVMPSGLQTPEGLSEPRETAPEPLTMVAAANGHGSVIDDADVVSMTVTTAPRRPTFLQQVRWDAVQQANLEGMSIRQMARDLGLHRDTVRRYIDVESPPTRRSRATPATVPSDTIPE